MIAFLSPKLQVWEHCRKLTTLSRWIEPL